MLHSAKKYIAFFSLSILFIIIVLSDQIIKNFLIAESGRYNLIIIRDFFEIKLFFNYNLSFLNFVLFPAIIYILVTFFVFMVFYKFIYSPLRINEDINALSLNIGAILIYGGALSNLMDRIRQGFVIDYFYLKWPISTVFNIADIVILIGSIILIKEIVKTKF